MFLIDDSYWEIRKTRSMGKGVYVKKIINAGTVIGDYLGVIQKPENINVDAHNMYTMWINAGTLIVSPEIDSPGIHLINHSCEPNCAMYPYFGHTLYFALRKIFPKEQLTIQYLIDPPTDLPVSEMHICKCHRPTCKGTLHGTEASSNRWGKIVFERNEKDKKKMKKYVPGRILPKLKQYPKFIDDNPLYDLFGSSTKKPKYLKHTQMPDMLSLRQIMRDAGKKLVFPKIGYEVYGFSTGYILLKEM